MVQLYITIIQQRWRWLVVVDISIHRNSEIIERNDRTAVAFSGRQIKFWKAVHLLSCYAQGNFFKSSRDSFCV